MKNDVLERFGRYILLDRIAQGGMAEVFRARIATAVRNRLIAIKRIPPGYNANAEFLEMFKSEIKITIRFNHPNVVQIYDFGEIEREPYLAMEFIDGKSLREVISRISKRKQLIPIELSVFIIEQTSAGLHYAHSYKDKVSGEALNIVHRDVFPGNILISYEGNPKIIDFGIAKLANKLESTRAGVIKGKPSYLSPEQISGEVLDGRSDIFALGAVLWESLTGKKLFSAESDLVILRLIETCDGHVTPPSIFNLKIPKELDNIVMKCLFKERDKRWETAEELQRALHKFLYSFMPEFNPSDLGYYMKDIFKNDIVADRKHIERLDYKAQIILEGLEHSNRSSLPELSSNSILYDDLIPSHQYQPGKRQLPESSDHIILNLTESQLEALENEASRLGLSREAFVASVLHQYVTGELVALNALELAKKLKDAA